MDLDAQATIMMHLLNPPEQALLIYILANANVMTPPFPLQLAIEAKIIFTQIDTDGNRHNP